MATNNLVGSLTPNPRRIVCLTTGRLSPPTAIMAGFQGAAFLTDWK
jgi:hypothetical protein